MARSESEIPRVLLLLGDEAALIEDAANALKEQVVPGSAAAFNAAVFRASEGAGGAVAQANTLPMMSRQRYVEVREVGQANAELLDALVAYAANPSPSTVMVLRGRKLGNTKAARALRAAVKKLGGLRSFKSRDMRPADVARKRVQEAGVAIAPDALRRLVELTGPNTAQLRMEVDKLVCAVGGEGRIELTHVEEACALVAEAVVWDLTDAIVARDGGRAMDACHRLIGGAGAQRSTHQLISMIAWQVRDLLALQEALRAGSPPPGRWARTPSWKLNKAKERLRRQRIDPAKVTAALARANRALNRSKAGDLRVFEGLVLELTAG